MHADADLVDALKAQLAEKELRVELLERLAAEKDTRLAERGERIAAPARWVRALADVEKHPTGEAAKSSLRFGAVRDSVSWQWA